MVLPWIRYLTQCLKSHPKQLSFEAYNSFRWSKAIWESFPFEVKCGYRKTRFLVLVPQHLNLSNVTVRNVSQILYSNYFAVETIWGVVIKSCHFDNCKCFHNILLFWRCLFWITVCVWVFPIKEGNTVEKFEVARARWFSRWNVNNIDGSAVYNNSPLTRTQARAYSMSWKK